MINRMLACTVTALIVCGIGACSKVNSDISVYDTSENTVANEDNKEVVSEAEETTVSSTVIEESTSKLDGDKYEICDYYPIVLHYPDNMRSTLITDFIYCMIVDPEVYSSKSGQTGYEYMVEFNVLPEFEGEYTLDEQIKLSVVDVLGYHNFYNRNMVDTKTEEVGDKDIPVSVGDVEGEYISINGIEVYRYTTTISTAGPGKVWNCPVYGYRWGYVTPETKKSDGTTNKYWGAGEKQVYNIIGVVTAQEHDVYEESMKDLVDYIVTNSEMLSE